MDDDTYTCAMCHETYDKGWSEEEALAELATNLPGVSAEECDIICDDCYKFGRASNWEIQGTC